MPHHAPVNDGNPRKKAPKPLPAKAREAPKKTAEQDEDAAMREWRELAELQFLDG